MPGSTSRRFRPSMTIVPPPSSTWCAGRARRLELLDRQVVDADHLDAVLDQMPGARLGHADVVRVELRRAPQPRVVRLDQHPDVLREIDGRADRRRAMPVRDVTSITRARPISISSGSASAPAPLVEKMPRGVDVRPGVRAHVERRHVRAVAAARCRLIGFEAERRVARVGRERARRAARRRR